MNNIIIRSSTGLAYASIILVSLFYDVILFSFIIFCFSCLTIFEFQKLINNHNIAPYFLMGLMFTFFLKQTISNNIILVVFFITIFSQFIMLQLLFNDKVSKKIIIKISSYCYLVFGCFFIIVIPFSKGDFNPDLLLFIYVLNWINNSFAYLIGKKFGKTKLLSKVSPNKSWEGFVGGFIFSCFTAYIFYMIQIKIKPIQIIICSVLVPILATLGDLIQSKIKREAGVKDSGNILPGHGGFFDRMDSIVFIAPWGFYILNQF